MYKYIKFPFGKWRLIIYSRADSQSVNAYTSPARGIFSPSQMDPIWGVEALERDKISAGSLNRYVRSLLAIIWGKCYTIFISVLRKYENYVYNFIENLPKIYKGFFYAFTFIEMSKFFKMVVECLKITIFLQLSKQRF